MDHEGKNLHACMRWPWRESRRGAGYLRRSLWLGGQKVSTSVQLREVGEQQETKATSGKNKVQRWKDRSERLVTGACSMHASMATDALRFPHACMHGPCHCALVYVAMGTLLKPFLRSHLLPNSRHCALPCIPLSGLTQGETNRPAKWLAHILQERRNQQSDRCKQEPY